MVVRIVVIEWFYAHVITSAKELLFLCIPYCKCKVAKQMIGAGLPPLFIGREDKCTVGDQLWGFGVTENPYQIFPVINSCIRGDNKSIIMTGKRKGLVAGFGSGVKHAVTKPDPACCAYTPAIRSPMGKGIRHHCETALID